jgi:hypothetical protein
MRIRRSTSILASAAAVIAAFLVPAAGPAHAATSVNENFESGVAHGFTVVTGTYSIISDGSMVYRTTSDSARSVVGDPASTDVSVQADVKVASWSTSTGRTAGLIARYTDVNDYYLFVYEDGLLKIKKKAAGTLTDLATRSFTWNTGTWYHLQGTVVGNALTLSVNGVQQLTATGSGLANGKVGVASFDGDVRDDNFVANDVTGGGSTTYDQTVLADSPVGFWDVSSRGGTEADLSGNGHTGSYVGGTTTTATLPNGDPANDFNGSTQYLSIPNSASFSIPTTGTLTWEAWIKPDTLQFPNDAPDYVDFLGKCMGYKPTCEWEGRMYDLTNSESRPSRLSAYVFNTGAGFGSAADWQPDANVISAGQWIHVVGEYSTQSTPAACNSAYPGFINVWVNGVEWNQSYHGDTGCMSQYSITPTATTSVVTLGTMGLDSWFEGSVAKFAVYNHLLTPAQITNHYKAMTGKTPTGSCVATCHF